MESISLTLLKFFKVTIDALRVGETLLFYLYRHQNGSVEELHCNCVLL